MNKDNKQQKLSDNKDTAITYSECYAQIFLGDCLELYKNLEPKSIDLILTDLPYGTTQNKWDSIIPFDKLWEMVNYLLKPSGAFITTASQPFTSALVMSNPRWFKYALVWNKVNASSGLHAKIQPLRSHEEILVFGKGRLTYNPQMTKAEKARVDKAREIPNGEAFSGKVTKRVYNNRGMKYPKSILTISNASQKGKVHPTQKPIALFEYLLKTYSNENMTIFDPCMGSGTTGVACKNLNRNFIGIEKDEAYFKMAEQRINARTLFSPPLKD